jgi:aminoglycoside 3-N-acetyltransferase I
MEISFKKLSATDSGDLTELIGVYTTAFEMDDFELPSLAYLETLLNKENLLFLTVSHENKIIGGLTAYILFSVYEEKTEVYIYEIGIKPEYQRKGIGQKLLSELIIYCKAAGHKNIFVQADVEDTHALDFYRKTGGREADVRHFNYEKI